MTLLRALTRNDVADERAVAPVISVILMVAVAVILASVIAVFALSFGEETDDVGPQADFSYDYDSSVCDLTVTHAEGDNIEISNLRFAGAAQEYTSYGSIAWDGSDSEVSAGESTTVSVAPDETLKIVWRKSSTAESTTVLNEYDVPDSGTCTSINSLTQEHAAGDYSVSPDENGKVTVEVSGYNVGGSLYAVIEDTSTYGSWSKETSISLSDNTGSTTFTPCRAEVGDGETLTVTIYKSNSKNTQVAQQTLSANAISGSRDGTPACEDGGDPP